MHVDEEWPTREQIVCFDRCVAGDLVIAGWWTEGRNDIQVKHGRVVDVRWTEAGERVVMVRIVGVEEPRAAAVGTIEWPTSADILREDGTVGRHRARPMNTRRAPTSYPR